MTQRASRSSTETPGAVAWPVRVGVIAGYALLLEVVDHVLGSHANLEIVGSGTRAADAVALVQHHKPDVLLLVHSGPNLDELNVIQRVSSLEQGTRLLVLSNERNQHALLRMLRVGAHGILSPDATSDVIVKAIHKVCQGDYFLTDQLQRACAERYLGAEHDRSPEEMLTEREFQVMKLIALGNSNREIAGQLGVGIKTIDTHRANMLRKLGLRNNADVARFAIKFEFIDP